MTDQNQACKVPAYKAREHRRRCWYDGCDRSWLIEWCGWKYCPQHYWTQVIKGCETKWQKLWSSTINWPALNWFAYQRRKQRQIDLDILWPSIKAVAPSLDKARIAMLLHMQFDPAWQEIPPAERVELIEHLR